MPQAVRLAGINLMMKTIEHLSFAIDMEQIVQRIAASLMACLVAVLQRINISLKLRAAYR